MSKRMKTAKAGAAKAGAERKKIRDVFVARPFEGLVDETEWIALRELVPAASAPLRLTPEYAQRYPERRAMLATVLPLALPAMNRVDGCVLIGLQRHHHSGDLSRDYAAALLCALETPLEQRVDIPALPGPGPRLQDILEPAALEITLHDKFDFWLEGTPAAEDAEVRASLDQANGSIYPTARMEAVASAYWCRLPERAHMRWVLPQDEDLALAALARVAAVGELNLGQNTKFAGMFRAQGRLIPVWDLPAGPEAESWETAMEQLSQRYELALAITTPLTQDEKRSRQGLVGRQIALR